MKWLTPTRRRGVEILDDPATPDDLRERAMLDLARSNRLFGGTRSVLRGLREPVRGLSSGAVLLDVGTGMADIAVAAARAAGHAGVDLFVIGMDISPQLARAAQDRVGAVVAGSALRIPIADQSVDIVLCSQVLHHFADRDARLLIAELHRVSRRWIVICDLRRSWLAAGGFWIASGLLRFHPVTRRDGVASVFRGFAGDELEALIHDVTGVVPRISRGAFWRVSATWKKTRVTLP